MTLFSALLSAILLFLYCLAFFVVYLADQESVRFNCPNPTNLTACDATLRVLGAPIPDVLFPIFLAVLGVLALIAIGLIGHLTGFHIYLMIKGISTYDHIRLQREAEQRAFAARTLRQKRSFRDICCCFHNIGRKTSRVTPTSDEEEKSSVSAGSPRHDGPRRSRSGSGGSLGNFGRTPPPSSDASSSDSGNNPDLSDDQKLIGKPPLPSILKPPSASRPSRKNDTVIEVELAALTAVTALSVISPAHHNDVNGSGTDDNGKKKKRNDQSNQGSPELPTHLRPSLSPPPSPVSSPRSTPKRYAAADDLGTLAFMAGRGFDNDFEDESMKPIVKIVEKKEKQVKKSHTIAESDPMDCSTLVAMAGINSVIESYEPIKEETVDRATSPTMPAHLVTEASNMNTNNNNVTEIVVKENASVDEDEAKKLKEQHRAQLLTQYHHVLREKKLKRTGSVGSIASRLSLPSALSLIPESQVPASRGVTDKLSNEFPLLTRNNAAATSVSLVGMSASATGIVAVTEESVKHVSFQDLSPSPAASNGAAMSVSAGESQHLIGRPLPSRPLPPIGGGADANLFSERNFPTMNPRSGNNRPLPPLNGMGMGNGNSVAYDTMSLHSAGSSTHILYRTGSTNSLPNPDPRYVRSHLKLMGGAKRKTPPPLAAAPVYRPLPTSASMGISNIGAGRLSPHQAQ